MIYRGLLSSSAPNHLIRFDCFFARANSLRRNVLVPCFRECRLIAILPYQMGPPTFHYARSLNRFDALLMSALRAAEKCALRFDSVANNLAAAMLAFRRQRMNGALETIKVMRDAVYDDLERFIVFVPQTSQRV